MPAGNLYSVLDSRDIIADFYPRLKAAEEMVWASDISVPISSSRAVEELAFLGQVSPMREWVGGRHETPLNKFSQLLSIAKYEATMRISNDDLRRDKTPQLRQRVSDLAVRTQTHWNSLHGSWITAGEAGTLSTAYDGQFFFDTDHNESGSNQTNDLGATEVPSSNVATTTTLTTTEGANIITETIAWMMGLTDDKGEPINQSPTSVFILVTKPGHYQGIKTAIGLNNLGTGSGNNNPILAWNDFPIRVKYVPQRITAADKLYFFFGTPGMGDAAFIRSEEFGVKTDLKDDTFDTDSQVFGVMANRGITYGMWQRAALVTLT